ncbi:hypothetical protein GJA_1975 [Janthinobacterium agaricidamnosum NBRC 102515 = DSM 9628]|uniref:Uncharacterized protein n=1 Tax=Janthinobacterium agaricidamnosum NBRC 102515 = DSM 9628 TaxID=1349767 RepID=W0V406_9BURK|nr:hypothetical protein GJA_1975 [Janthinobacterium agaricidamnosum NBRC 102515 = DSM 9628]
MRIWRSASAATACRQHACQYSTRQTRHYSLLHFFPCSYEWLKDSKGRLVVRTATGCSIKSGGICGYMRSPTLKNCL